MSRTANRRANVKYAALFAFFFIYYISTGLTSFLPKFYSDIGMTDSRIGIMTSVPTLISMAFLPFFGSLSDRISQKRYLLAIELVLMSAACFAFQLCGRFIAMLVIVTLYSIFAASPMSVATTISLEYCTESNRPFGPIRMVGTVGYQAGLLLVAVFLSDSLKSLYPLMGIAVLVSCATTALMPNIEGHQKRGKKMPIRALFHDKRLIWLYGIVLFATISSQFYASFFTKHLGDLGMSNRTVSIISLFSVFLEIPFLWFGDRIKRKMSVWNWLMLGMLLNGVRWLGLSVFKTVGPIMLVQILGLTTLACFEFVPAFYLEKAVAPELIGTAQSMLHFTTFGIGRAVGGLLGGFVCEKLGIPFMFCFFGCMLLCGCAIFRKPTRKLIQLDGE